MPLVGYPKASMLSLPWLPPLLATVVERHRKAKYTTRSSTLPPIMVGCLAQQSNPLV